MRAVVIGLGGIGTQLIESLTRSLVFSKDERTPERLLLIDGDAYEDKNKVRQRFNANANKAEVTKDWLENAFPDSGIDIEAKGCYINGQNILVYIREGDIVFLCVDNHATRKLASDHVAGLRDCLLISGGNEEWDGNIQVFERKDGKNVNPTLTFLHPEIEKPKDKNPADIPCGTLVEQGATQLLAVNMTVATLMLNAFTMWTKKGTVPYDELYFDVKTGNMRPVRNIDKGLAHQ